MRRIVFLLIIVACIAANKRANTEPLPLKRFFAGGSLNLFVISYDDFDFYYGSKSGLSLGGFAGVKLVPKAGLVFKLRTFGKANEMTLWIPEIGDSVHYKLGWNQYFLTFSGRYYPVVTQRLSPYLDGGFVFCSASETWEVTGDVGHDVLRWSTHGIGLALGGGLQISIVRELSVFGEVEFTWVGIKGEIERLNIERDYDAGGPFFGGGISLAF